MLSVSLGLGASQSADQHAIGARAIAQLGKSSREFANCRDHTRMRSLSRDAHQDHDLRS
jgi:hypothetical protein